MSTRAQCMSKWTLLVLFYCLGNKVAADFLPQQNQEFVLEQFNLLRGTNPLIPTEPLAPLKWDSELEMRSNDKICQSSEKFVSYQSPRKAAEVPIDQFFQRFIDVVGRRERDYFYQELPQIRDGEHVKVKHKSNYTQIVWKNSRRVGCAFTTCPSGLYGIVCLLDPSGKVPVEDFLIEKVDELKQEMKEKKNCTIQIISGLILCFWIVLCSVVFRRRMAREVSDAIVSKREPLQPKDSILSDFASIQKSQINLSPAGILTPSPDVGPSFERLNHRTKSLESEHKSDEDSGSPEKEEKIWVENGVQYIEI